MTPHVSHVPRRDSAWRRVVPACKVLALLVGMAVLVAACGFNAGGDEIAFVRDGQLWTVAADGSNAALLVGAGVQGFAWSPSHAQLVVRTGTGAVLAGGNEAGAPEAPGNLSVTSADGGGTVTITPAIAGLARSDAWWDADGNRLLYAEEFAGSDGQATGTPFYVLSQPDQPAGIARVVLQGSGIPALAPDGTRVAAVDASGALRVGRPGTSGAVVATEALLTLAVGNRPARVLWQPGRDAVLYAQAQATGQTALVLVDLTGHARTLGMASDLVDYTFAPDGTQVLVQTAGSFAIWPVNRAGGGVPTFSWDEADQSALAWWSPDDGAVLVSDATGLRLADIRHHTVRQLLTLPSATAATPTAAARWHPLAGSPFSADGTSIVFADADSARWLGQPLPLSGGAGGLYVAQLAGAPGTPRLIARGAVEWPSWSYLDPNCSWLVGI